MRGAGGPEAAAEQAGARSGSDGSCGGTAPAGPTPPPAARAAAPLRIYAAGDNGYGQCGVPPLDRWLWHDEYVSNPIGTPVVAGGLQPPEGVQVEKISCGETFLIMLTTQGVVLHAGAGHVDQQGNGGADDDPHPELREVPLPCPAVDIAAGPVHAAAALSSGAAVTWGSNILGELGRAGCENTPGAAEGVTEAERVYAGNVCTFFLSRGGEVAACGVNYHGELCLGHAHPVQGLQRVAALSGLNILQMQFGAEHCILLQADGSVLAWGSLGGSLADGSHLWSEESGCVPIRLDVGPALCVAAGPASNAVVTAAEGTLWVWHEDTQMCKSAKRLPGDAQAAAVLCNGKCTFSRSAEGRWSGEGPFGVGLPSGYGHEEALGPLADCVPVCGSFSKFALYLYGSDAEQVACRSTGIPPLSGVLSFSGRVLHDRDLHTPLSELGVSAQAVLQLLRIPRLPLAAGGAGSQRGAALTVYVDASPFGAADTIFLELHPEATALDLVAAAAHSLGIGQ
eukprot:TRINITY_DN27685_c0_g1_i1.p1 TRINITY_DN27685_c0_g1~~TRINITY_DN27685_c0_g1_i1.p1  ORF type:complete len:542 (+),score=133.45 TRINITY_DN27685_c0_g1_i1:95-1627(+)